MAPSLPCSSSSLMRSSRVTTPSRVETASVRSPILQGRPPLPAGSPAPRLRPLDAAADRPLLVLLDSGWIRADQEQRALALAATTLVPEHYGEVAARRIAHVDKTLAAVHERLTKEISRRSDRWIKLRDETDAGSKDVRLNLETFSAPSLISMDGWRTERRIAGHAPHHPHDHRSGRGLIIPYCTVASAARRSCPDPAASTFQSIPQPAPGLRNSPCTQFAPPRRLAANGSWMSPHRNVVGISPPTLLPWMASCLSRAILKSKVAFRAQLPSL